MLVYFDICAIPIYISILISLYSKKMTKGSSNLIFIALILISLIVTISDIVASFLVSRSLFLSNADVFIGYIFNYMYFALRNLTPLLYILFLFSITRSSYKNQSIWVKLLLIVPYIIATIALVMNIFTNDIFSITKHGGYSREKGIVILYLVFSLYYIFGASYTIYCRKLLRLEKWLASMAVYIVIFISTITQYMYPHYLVEMFSMSIALFLVTIFILKPEDIMDSVIRVPGYISYQDELKKLIIRNQKVKIFMIKFINSNDISGFLGNERYNFCMKKVYTRLNDLCKKEKLRANIYFEYPSGFYIVVDELIKNIEISEQVCIKLQKKLKDIEYLGAKFVAKTCMVHIPYDFNTCDEIIRFANIFYKLMKQGEYFAYAKDIVKRKDFKIEANIDSILERAIKNNSFEIYYQPIYCVKEKRFLSAEALIRLNDEVFGFIPPSIFIPEAEQKGLMHIIGNFVIKQVYDFISRNNFEKLGLSFIEINLSVAQCIQKDLPTTLENLRGKYNIKTDKVNFEITETTYDISGDIIENNMKLLSKIGYSFAMDDYGTGYSNINRIFKLPLKMIKIDKSLVDNIDTKEGMSIIDNTIRMIKKLNMEVVVEGVEREDIVEKLSSMDCDFIQGYYFSKPLPEKEFINFVKEHNSTI